MSNQDEEKQSLTQEQAQRAVEKLQAFYDSLPQDEKMVLETVLSMAAGAEVTGHTGEVDRPIILGSVLNAELSIFRPSNGAWYVQGPQAASAVQATHSRGGWAAALAAENPSVD